MLKMRHRPVGTREGDAVNLLSSSDQECLRQDLEMSQVMAHSPLNEFMALQDLLLFWMRVLGQVARCVCSLGSSHDR